MLALSPYAFESPPPRFPGLGYRRRTPYPLAGPKNRAKQTKEMQVTQQGLLLQGQPDAERRARDPAWEPTAGTSVARASYAKARGWLPGPGSGAAHLRGRALLAVGPRVSSGSRPHKRPSIRAALRRPPPPPPLPASPFLALQAAEAAARVGRGASYPRATPRTLPTREPKAAPDLPGWSQPVVPHLQSGING